MTEEKLSLEQIRFEFLKRGDDHDKVLRARRYLSRRETAHQEGFAVSNVKSHSEETTEGTLFRVTLDIDIYASDEQIELDLIDNIMRHIRNYRKLHGNLAVPEIRQPERGIHQGSRPDEIELPFMLECLKVHDMCIEGKSISEIAMTLFNDKPGTDSWDSSRQKVFQRLKNAKSLIEAAQRGVFPNIV